MNAIYFYKVSRYLYKLKLIPLAKIVKLIIFVLYNSSIPYQVIIGKRTKFGYGGIGVVLHKNSVIGNGCTISQQVTIGGRSGLKEVPYIGDNVYIGAGAKVLGPIKIGNNVTIGANAVVINDVPDNSVVAGVPARIIKR
ncbi:serine acetyltransferase [Bacillus sp. Soil745]|nr:serine acetyltransferase [Bacillus sp. Soil745]